MDETLEAVRLLRAEGIPVIGYTWFPLFTMVDWKYRKGKQKVDKYLIHLGFIILPSIRRGFCAGRRPRW